MGAIASKVAAPLTLGTAAYTGLNTGADTYSRRFNLDPNSSGVASDLGTRALGVASDVGNALTMGGLRWAHDQLNGEGHWDGGAPGKPAQVAQPSAQVAQPSAQVAQPTASLRPKPEARKDGDWHFDTDKNGKRTVSNIADTSDRGFFNAVVASDAKHAAEDKAAQATQGSLRGGASGGLADLVAQATAIFGPPPSSSGMGSMVDAAGQAKYRRQIADFVSHAYSADAPVRSRQMDMQYAAQMRGFKAQLWKQANGDPIAYSKLASSMGMVEDPLATAKEMQTLGTTASKAADTRIEHHAASVNKNGEGYIDPAKLAVARNVRNSLAPGYQGLNEQEQSALQPDIDAGINITANKLRNTNWLQKLGWDQPDPLETTLPNMEGANASYVTPWEGLTTPDVSMGDVKMTLRGGKARYLPRDKFNENEMNLFKKQGGKFGNQ